MTGVALALAVALAGGCSRASSDAAGSPAPSPTATGPVAAPPPVDPASLNAVFAALERVTGDVVRRIAVSGTFTPEDASALRSVYLQPMLASQLIGFEGLVGRLGDAVRQPPGDHVVTVERVVTARADCVYVEATVDMSATLVEAPAPRTTWFALRSRRPEADPLGLNPTPWAIAAEHAQPANPCG